MSPIDKKLELKLNEDNELSFKLSIEGTVSDPELASPRFRFTVTEMGEERGWIFPARKEADDIVTVSIPAPLKAGFKSGRVYKGTLEVILGRLYFSPAEVQLEFATPLEIQAEITQTYNHKASNSSEVHSKQKTLIEERPGSSDKPTEDYDEEEILSVIVEEKKKAKPVTSTQTQKTMVSEKRLQTLRNRNTPVKTPQRSTGLAQKPISQKQNGQSSVDKDAAQKEMFKAKLLNMFKSALVD